jgi:hypothetical protein
MKKSSPILLKIVSGASGSFVFLTLTWILWGLFTPGDFFGNGSPLVYVSAITAGLIGFVTGFRKKPKWMTVSGILLVALCLFFWLFVRDGWWATPPPMPSRAESSIHK